MESQADGITILTDPVPFAGKAGLELARRLIRKACPDIAAPYSDPGRHSIRGHYAVTRSLLDGMDALGVTYTYNPTLLKDVRRKVVVLSGIQALRQAIAWRTLGRIDCLLAGPNIVELPTDCGAILTSNAIDLIITPSQWVTNAYIATSPVIAGRCVEWAAGVDADYWACTKDSEARQRLLIYAKPGPSSVGNMLEATKEVAHRHGYTTLTLAYGDHSREDYRATLSQVHAMVVLGGPESQGISLTEAWASNTPTFVKESTILHLRGHSLAASAAPYLTNATGALFNTPTELAAHLQALKSRTFEPRSWVLKNMTDTKSARLLLSYVH